MICKKCGREYDDDMPKCLWCSAPNDGPNEQAKSIQKTAPSSSTHQSAFIQDEPENVRRGKSAITWIKINIVYGVLLALASERMISIFKLFAEMAKNKQPSPIPPSSALFILAYIFLAFIACILFTVYVIKSCRWLYYNIKFQRKYTTTKFSPWNAVICTMIPWLSGFLDYFIFKDLLARQQEVLTAHGDRPATVPPKMLTGIFALTALSFVSYFYYDSIVLRLFGIGVLVILALIYIKVMTAIVENEKLLHAMREREIVNRKVEEILAQRENS